jgi:hypothetical protein
MAIVDRFGAIWGTFTQAIPDRFLPSKIDDRSPIINPRRQVVPSNGGQ